MDAPAHRNISAWAIRNPVATAVLFLALTVAGLATYPLLRINNMPDIDLPVVAVTVMQPGAAPSEMETQITRRVEDTVAGLGDVRHILSTVVDGTSTTMIEFNLGKNIDRATNDVRDRVARIRTDLPADIREPVVTRIEATGGAILTYTVSAPAMNDVGLSWFVENEIAKSLLSVRGVAEINRIGGVAREIRVALRPDRMQALGITAAQVNEQLRAQNVDLPGGRGTVGASEQTIRTLNAAESVETLRARSIVLPSGRTARLDELAEVTDSHAEIRSAARLDGLPVVAFEVLRTKGSSEVAVAEGVAERVASLQAAHPGVEIRQVASTVDFVVDGYHAAVEALVVGAALAMLVVWIFLRDWRATWIASIAMPLSLLPTFAVMWAFGFSLNNVTLLGLTLVVGVLVDDAIVEIENIVRHLRAHPERGVRRAALDASAEIGLAVMATTATILAVFVPVAFMPGIPGQFFREFGLTVAAAVAFSLVVARLLTPLLGAHFLKASGQAHDEDAWGWFGRRYIPLLHWCLRHRLTTVVAGVGFLGVSVAMLPLIPQDFVPGADRGRAALAIELAPGATLADTEAVVREATRILKQRPETQSVFAALGTANNGQMAIGSVTQAGDPRQANLTVTLVPRGQRSITQQQYEALVRPELERLPGARVRFGADGQSGSRLEVTLVSEDSAALAGAARELERQMRTLPQLAGARSTASLARPEIQIVPREGLAADAGISAATIAATARIATTGDVDQNLARFNLPDRQIPIRVMLDERMRGDLAQLSALQVTGRGGAVPLGSVAELRHGAGPAQIDRLDRVRKATVQAELNGLPLGAATALVNDLPILRNLPEGVRQQAVGDAEVMRELFSGFGMALGAGVLMVYLVLVLLFGGFLQPLTIMSALPLSLGGALLALLIAQKSLGVSAVIGVLMLMGIVAKNSILLVEYAILARQERGLGRDEAIVEAARKRARPIIMTTIAMCAGMAHIAMGLGADSEFRSPMALVVIGGLLTSTLLSLVFVPVAYSYMDGVENWLGRRLQGRPRPSKARQNMGA